MAFAGTRVAQAERSIFGVPARFMGPRILLVAATAALTAFGLVMIYSASSITALYSYGDAAHYLVRQAAFIVVGAVLAVGVSRLDYHEWSGWKLIALWVVLLLMLAAVRVFGTTTLGAKRWFSIGPFTVQPSEFAKPVIILLGADLLDRYLVRGELSAGRFWWRAVVFVVVPVGIILLQPDKGTTGILALTALVMLYLVGIRGAYVGGLLGALGVVGLGYSMRDSYSQQRIQAMLDPFLDATDNGYQLVQGFYAFGSGGLLGVGIGMSRQKYNYLPMAYNDFIFAVVGEELGLVGTLSVLALFALFLWAGFRIAEEAPDVRGRMVAGGATALFGIQLLLNVCGVLGLFPLSGKPVPFLSYGGSSIVANFILVGLILSVSRQSRLPETEYDRRRSQLRLAGDDSGVVTAPRGRTGVVGTSYRNGTRNASRGGYVPRESALGTREHIGSVRNWGNVTPFTPSGSNAGSRGGWARRDLNDDPADRLWKHDNTQNRGRGRSRGGRSDRGR